LAGGDVFSYFYPYWAEATRAIRSLRVPGWNPYLFMGVPFAANSQVGFFYPLNWPLWLLLPPHRSVHVAIVLHLCLAAVTAYVWGRRGLRLGRLGAWTVGAAFALGGYLSAQVEHVNQLQGLAWLPLMLTLAGEIGRPVEEGGGLDLSQSPGWLGPLTERRVTAVVLLASVIGLVLLAGHTQTAFIALVGTAVYAALPGLVRLARRKGVSLLVAVTLLLTGAAVLGAGLAAVQLVPTWQLSGLSVRAEGLPFNERVSFSLSPLYVGRALLPPLRGAVPPDHLEHVAYVGSAGIVVAMLGLTVGWRRGSGGVDTGGRREGKSEKVREYVMLALGVGFALGLYNPLYVLLARYVPGFAHFRVPARWLALYALTAAGLIGRGFEALAAGRGLGRGAHLVPAGGLLLLIVWAMAGSGLEVGPRLDWMTMVGWIAMGAAAVLMVWLADALRPVLGATLLVGLLVGELWLAGEALPKARATAPQAYTGIRPAVAHLLASEPGDGTPKERFLSLSDTTFDPGDLSLIELIYGEQLSEAQLYEYIVAAKQKEILSPNLPLALQIPAVDGYDGGVLPLGRYVSLQRAFLSPDEVSLDGRLRENMEGVPDAQWLSLLNVRYIITDKLRDAWVDDVFYDLQFGARLSDGESVRVAEVPGFEATALGIVSHVEEAESPGHGTMVGGIEIGFADGTDHSFELSAGEEISIGAGGGNGQATRVRWQDPAVPLSITLHAASSGTTWNVRGLSLIDERTGSFRSMVVTDQGRFRLAHSGDVKIYENLEVLPRAFVVSQARVMKDDEAALDAMQASTTDLAAEVILSDSDGTCKEMRPAVSGDDRARQAGITAYDAERVVIGAELDSPGYLVLTDAAYPGWRAEVDGEPTAICRANLLFRAVPLEAGRHEVVLTFRSRAQQWGMVVTAVVAGVWVFLLTYKKRLSDT
jgi:hypothetical protein